ncbi:hypothetical protein BJ878DRAFT_581303 [Calycina marina]|uniref:ubiquitinyl hydrolase 1 n=1 Tax=Calycina marina TaxID=1763456 RepID=A0A9P7Z6H9_9HELO|nr:hypothetical protein BJ878DRAFT_581303 [Calycina marina]
MSQKLSDLYDGDSNFDFDFEYHQDYQEADFMAQYKKPKYIIPTILFTVALIYQLGASANYNLLSISDSLWNALVYLTPTRLLDIIEMYQSPLRMMNPSLRDTPRTHAAKSEAMRRILGLDKPGGILSNVAEAGRRRMSIIPGVCVTERRDGQPAGLGNWDNSCYQNSVLQGLASLGSLSEYLTRPESDSIMEDGAAKPETKMADSLRGLIATLNSAESNGKRIWTPATLKNMSSWQQQDAQEYFSKVLDEIDKEVGKFADAVKKSQGFESDDSTSSRNSDVQFRNPLEGLIAQRIGCTSCGFSEGLSMIPFNCLTVPLGRAWEFHISECLDEYTNLEEIEGVECGRCTLLKGRDQLETLKERNQDAPESDIYKRLIDRLALVTEALEEDDYSEKTLLQKCSIKPKIRVSSTKTRQAVIARPPKSLVLHFNRSVFNEMTGELLKNSANVRFPRTLDLGPWCLGSYGDFSNTPIEEWRLNPAEPMVAGTQRVSRMHGPMYELRAVVTHYGRHENGHYICYKKHPIPASKDDAGSEAPTKQQWWRLSDDEVMKVSEENVLGQGGVFMLFFDLIETASPISSPSPVDAIVQDMRIAPASELDMSPVAEVAPTTVLAAAVPLPDTADMSLFKDGDLSINTSHDDNDAPSLDHSTLYTRTKAIILPHTIPTSSINSEEEQPANPGTLTNSNLIMI